MIHHQHKKIAVVGKRRAFRSATCVCFMAQVSFWRASFIRLLCLAGWGTAPRTGQSTGQLLASRLASYWPVDWPVARLPGAAGGNWTADWTGRHASLLPHMCEHTCKMIPGHFGALEGAYLGASGLGD